MREIPIYFYVSYPWWVSALRRLNTRFGNWIYRFEVRYAVFTAPDGSPSRGPFRP